MSHAKFPILVEKIREELARRGFGSDQALPTEAEFAARYDTTAKTVRRALRELAHQGLLEHGRGRRSVLRADVGWDRRVPFLVGSASVATGGIFGRIVQGMKKAADGQGLSLVLKENDENPDRIRNDVKELLGSGARVLLHAPIGTRTAESVATDAWILKEVRKHKARLITVDRHLNGQDPARCSHVGTDNEIGGRRAAEVLAEARYPETFWVMMGGRETSASDARIRGFTMGLQAAGAPTPRGFSLGTNRGAKELLEAISKGRSMGIFILADYVALHFMAWLRQQGLGIMAAERMGLVTFDDLEVSRAFGISVLDQPLEAIGEKAMTLATRFLREPRSADEEVFLEPRWIERGSTRKVVATATR